MLAHLSRLPLSLDPLIAEAKRRARQRRALVGLGLLALVGLAAALTLTFRSPGGGGPATASFAKYGVSLRYPAAWAEADWSCYFSSQFSPLVVLTTTHPAPKCTMLDSSFPPRERLGADGIMVTVAGLHPFPTKIYKNPSWNTRIDGQRARVTVSHLRTGLLPEVTCATGGSREYLTAQTKKLAVTAVICGPGYGPGQTAVRRLLASVRFGG